MTSETFNTWLFLTKASHGPVGDLAKDAAADPDWPEAPALVVYVAYLEGRGADPNAVEALRRAWRRWHAAGGVSGELPNPAGIGTERIEIWWEILRTVEPDTLRWVLDHGDSAAWALAVEVDQKARAAGYQLTPSVRVSRAPVTEPPYDDEE